MNTAKTNTKLVDSYFIMLKNLSPNHKLELISRLSKSMTTGKAANSESSESWKTLFGALVLEQLIDDFIDGLKKDRHFIRKSIEL